MASNDSDSSPGGRLDGPPPAPTGVMRRAPEPTVPAASAMGGTGAGVASNFPQAIIERAMLAEESLKSLAQILPDLMPVMAQMIDTLRAAVGGAVQGGPTPNPAMGPMAGMLSAPAQPSPAGAGAPPPMM